MPRHQLSVRARIHKTVVVARELGLVEPGSEVEIDSRPLILRFAPRYHLHFCSADLSGLNEPSSLLLV